MTPDQIDNALDELTVRLERVRALYEQYFMGLERLEPSIPRKDIERRMYELQRTRFQNTAKRFKFQTLVQRYNTLQQYWNRTCRDIENGTYRKHVLRAERRFGKAKEPPPASTSSPGADERVERAVLAREKSKQDLQELLSADVDLDAELEKALVETDTAKGGLLGKLSGKEATGVRTSPAPQAVLAPLAKGLTAGPPPAVLPSKEPPDAPGPRVSPPPVVLRHSSRPPAPAGGAAGTLRSSAGDPGKVSALGVPPLPAETSGPRAAPPRPLPTRTAAAGLPPARAKMETEPGMSAPPRRSPAVPAPAANPPQTAPATNARAADAARAVRAEAARVATARAEVARVEAALSEDRIRALHQKYVEARKQTNASTVSLDKLARSIRETERKLREQHKGRAVDFDVTIKDGKAILKPKLK